MKLTLLSVEKQVLIEVEVLIDGQRFNYFLDSDYYYNKFLAHYYAGRDERALAVLNRSKIKGV